jgi:hypothetical protein
MIGGSGSNKGEFIWELLQQCDSCENAGSMSRYVYHYIDAEKLILDNIGKRIKKLTTERTSSANANEDGRESKAISISETSIKSNASDDLKTKMLLYANIVTNNWVLGLISKEIDKHAIDAKKVFIVNLIPNRINMFRNCLYLKQAPSFVNFHFNYIAINLIKSNSKRKDIDQLGNNSEYDEVNSNFINYFRLVNKLIEIKVERTRNKIKIKITKSKNAIKIVSHEDLLSFIHTPKKDGMEIDVSEFNCSQTFQTSILFVIKNEIDIDDNYVLVYEENDTNVEKVKNFVQILTKERDSLLYKM